jgi:hypothetical protein
MFPLNPVNRPVPIHRRGSTDFIRREHANALANACANAFIDRFRAPFPLSQRAVILTKNNRCSSPHVLSSRGAKRRRICGCLWEFKVAIPPSSRPHSRTSNPAQFPLPQSPVILTKNNRCFSPHALSSRGAKRRRICGCPSELKKSILPVCRPHSRNLESSTIPAPPTRCHPEEQSDEGSAVASWKLKKRYTSALPTNEP